MKFTTALSVIALAATAAATPVDVEARTGGGGGGDTPTCNTNQQLVCCASVVGVSCLVDILGGNCNGGTYCCNGGGSIGGLININALNCVKVL